MAASGDAMPQRLRPLPGLVQAPGHLLVIAAKCVLPPHPQWGPWAFQERPAHGSPPAMLGDSYLRLSLAAVHLVQKPGPFPPR